MLVVGEAGASSGGSPHGLSTDVEGGPGFSWNNQKNVSREMPASDSAFAIIAMTSVHVIRRSGDPLMHTPSRPVGSASRIRFTRSGPSVRSATPPGTQSKGGVSTLGNRLEAGSSSVDVKASAL